MPVISYDGPTIINLIACGSLVPLQGTRSACSRISNQKMAALIGTEFSKGTFDRYQTSLKHTVDFLQWKYEVQDIDIRKVDHAFIAEYDFYLRSVRKCANNSAVKYLKNFGKIIRICLSSGWLSVDPFLNYKNKVKKVDRVFLTPEESIPLLPTASAILKKYEHHRTCLNTRMMLPVMSNQKTNSYLKEIADFCGIQKLLTFHIARHTFATTVTLLNGMPIESVSKMLGHTNIQTTQHYAKILDIKVGADMALLKEKYAAL